ncbi:MAG TPA: hypothetical protein VFH38_10210 [Jatrophihabitans sp.]|nr:hypothetical protein [Jatrophihabitans sp.]
MPLSEYELRVLQEMELALRTRRLRRLALGRQAVARQWRLALAILAALATVVLLAVFAPGAAAAPVGCVAGAVVGWMLAWSRTPKTACSKPPASKPPGS